MGIQSVFGLANLAFQCLKASRQLAHFKLFGGSKTQLIGAARLYQIVGCARLNGINSRIDRRVCSHDDHTHPRCLNTHLRQYIQAVIFTQTQIEKAQVENLALHERVSLGCAVGSGDTVTFVFQTVPESAEDGGLIVHKQNTALILSGCFHFSYAP